MNSPERKSFYQIKNLLTSIDYDKIDQAISRLREQPNPEFFELLLKDCFVVNGSIIASKNLTVGAPRQPYIDYALWNLVGYAPAECKLNESLKKGKITSIQFISYQSYLHHYHYIERFPVGLTELSNLRSLNFSETRIQKLSPEIGKLTKLTSLIINGNEIKHLPQEIGQLTKLIKLEVNSNNLKSIPSTIGKLTRLRYLSLDNNYISELPAEIGLLVKLEKLELQNNKLRLLPGTITNLTGLQLFNISGNRLERIPRNVGNFQLLTELDCSHNRLTQIPGSLNRLSELKELDLSYNRFTIFPHLRLSSLQKLDLSGNELTSVPDYIRDVPALQSLRLTENRNFGTFEAGISFLDNLTRLAIGQSGRILPAPRFLNMDNKKDIQDFFEKIRRRYKLLDRNTPQKPIENPGKKRNPAQASSNVRRDSGYSQPSEENDWFTMQYAEQTIANIRNYLQSEDIDTIDIGIDLVTNLGNPEIYAGIFRHWRLFDGELVENYSRDESVFASYYKDKTYSILRILAEAPPDIEFPNNIRIEDIRKIKYPLIRNRAYDFLLRFLNLENLEIDCDEIALENNFHPLKKIKSLDIQKLKNPAGFDFHQFPLLETLNISYFKESGSFRLTEHGNLHKLTISDSEFNELIIENNPKLKTLDLTDCKCTTLVIRNCPSLEELKLYQINGMNEFRYSSFPSLVKLKIIDSEIDRVVEFASGNTLLETLEIRKTKLTELNESINKLQQLSVLDLSENQLKQIPDEIGSLKCLKILVLKKNKLKNLPNSLSGLSNLRELNLRYQSGSSKAENTLNELPLSLLELTNIESIKVSWQSLTFRKFSTFLLSAGLSHRLAVIANN